MIAMPLTARQWRTRALTAAAVAFAVTCIGWPVRQAVMGAVETWQGPKTPVAAAKAYLLAVFEPGDSPGINGLLCSENRDELFREALALRKQVEPHATFGVKVESTDWHTIDSGGGVSAMVNLRFTKIDPTTGDVTFTGGTVQKWQFHTKEERGISGGWKVCRVEAPPL
ncbi:hypothetical protein ABT346_27700 [Micromonospora peucetia]|uniref:hypothetical protein n=1 Tax=Micromonospora peucetia TaxID=47871 RepID=UPI00331A28E1